MSSAQDDPANARTDNDLTEKAITPMGGFSHFGEVREDWLMLKGTVMGPRKRLITLRKSLLPQVSRKASNPVKIKAAVKPRIPMARLRGTSIK